MLNDPRKNNLATFNSHGAQKCPETRPKSLHLQITLARTQLREGKLSEGIETYFTIATEMVLKGELGKAAAIYKLILKDDSNNPLALAFLSSLYHHQGLEAEARQLHTPPIREETRQEETSPIDNIALSEIGELEKILPSRKVEKNEAIITQNQANHNLYLIAEGRFQVVHQETSGQSLELATLGKGNFFGEITMLLPNRNATATIIALESGKLLTIAREEFRHFLKVRPPLLKTLLAVAHKRLLEYTLRPLFISGDNRDLPWLSRIAEVFQIRQFSAQELLLKEGERNQSLYVILDGNLQVSCQGSDIKHQIPITNLNAGDFFGEFSLLTGEAASATVRALSTGWVACLKRREVDRLATHFPEFLPRILNSFRARKQSLIKKKINYLSTQPRQELRGER